METVVSDQTAPVPEAANDASNRDGAAPPDDPDQLRRQARNRAAELIATDGMTWNMTTLARMTGVSRGCLYRHFIDKADVIGHVFDRTVTRGDLRLLRSIQWTPAWRPTTAQDWADVHAQLCRGNRRMNADNDGDDAPFRTGDRVYVTDPALTELRQIMRSGGYTPTANHIGTVNDVEPDRVLIYFDNEEGPGLGQSAPYPPAEVRHLPEPGDPVYAPWQWQNRSTDE